MLTLQFCVPGGPDEVKNPNTRLLTTGGRLRKVLTVVLDKWSLTRGGRTCQFYCMLKK